MDKTLYIVATGKNSAGKLWAFVMTMSASTNLINAFPDTTITANVCNTKKKAYEIMDFWNDCFKKNGTYAF